MSENSSYRRRRALSFGGTSEHHRSHLSKCLNSDTSEQSDPKRERHPSLAVTGDHSLQLRKLFNANANKITNLSITRKTANLNKSVASIEDNSSILIRSNFDINDSDLPSRKESTSTIIATQESCNTSSSQSNNRSGLTPKSSNTEKDNNSVCIVPSSPITSSLVKLYLSKVLTSSSSGLAEEISTVPSNVDISNVPDCLRISPPAVASMVMPVRQISRAHNSQNRVFHREKMLSNIVKSDAEAYFKGPYPYDRYAMTDTSYSSGISDNESSFIHENHSPSLSYLPDNHLIEGVSVARYLKNTGKMLEQHLHHPIRSIRFSSNQSLSQSKESLCSHSKCADCFNFNPKFEPTHIYDGLIPSISIEDDLIHSSENNENQFNHLPIDYTTNSFRSTPSSPNLRRKSTLKYLDDTHINPLERLRTFWDNHVKNLTFEMDKHYFYMDEKSMENRVNAQASNIISPVSF